MFSVSESHMARLTRQDVLYWACHWQLESCINFTSILFKQWQSVSLGFPAEYKPAALCAGVRQFPQVFYNVFDSFTQSLVKSDRSVFLSALACTRNSSHLHYLMKTVFIDKNQMMIGHYEKLHLVKQILARPENVKPVVLFLVQNYDTALSM
ncbi:hypothetical protein J6590_086431 [Homalodisca vitripennis]|nr:hypothetical protein J6590_086431 [Homalodisca vitripennis]